MNVLAVNCGSSTLKFQLMDTAREVLPGEEQALAGGTVDAIPGAEAVLHFRSEEGHFRQTWPVYDHAEAANRVLGWLESRNLVRYMDAVGHRVVHGADLFTEPVLINESVIQGIESLRDLAPLHNEPALAAIHAMRDSLEIRMVAVFDTAFHAAMPENAARYAIPDNLAGRHRIRRYGFHGLAHRFMLERYSAITSRPAADARLVTLQLGNGCSAAAIERGCSVDTSMGFTPLEGMVMGTRSGNIDPSIPGYLARHEGIGIEEVEDRLNTKSGLLGVSGLSRDMRELMEAESAGDARAALAIDIFCHSVRKYIAAYMAVLGGADAVIFGGGIGENSPGIRQRICAGMDWCGLSVDPGRNREAVGREGLISTDSARVRVYVVPVNEASVIAREAARCLQGNGCRRVSPGT
ncbi:MAG: acetate kinase [Dehalococcoidia bacterium]|nr:acetate kinase [Dehalococcoidia bacterium]